MAEYLTQIKMEIYTVVNWTDISQYVVSEIEGEYGLPEKDFTDRVADTGYIKFELNNVDGLFSPGLSTSLPGWGKGTKIKLTLYLNNESWVKFLGSVDTIDIDTKDFGSRRVKVTALDWMNTAATAPLSTTSILTDKRIDEAVQTLVNSLVVQPQETEYQTGEDTFPTVFDSVKSNSKALTEFSKLAMSELGYIYLRRSKTTGEKLVVESRATRNSSILARIPLISAYSGRHLLTSGGYRLLTNGGKKILHQSTTFSFDNNMKDIEVENGGNVINYITLRAHPREVSASTSVLFTLNEPMYMEAYETRKIRGTYKDSNGNKVNATDYVTPVADTHYQMFQNSDGSGTELTDNLSITPTFGSEAFTYEITNNDVAGYITLLTAEAKAIYIDEPIEYVTQDNVSIATYDYRTLTIDQPYQTDLSAGSATAFLVVNREKEPRTVVNKIILLANQDVNSLVAFLTMDIGDLIKVIEEKANVNASYYIYRIGYKISLSGIIEYWFGVQDALTLNTLFWQVGTTGRTEVGNLIVGSG